MQKRKFDELISHFNRKVSDMSIDQKYKMELLGMISAIGFAHEKELGTDLAEVGTDLISRQAAIEAAMRDVSCIRTHEFNAGATRAANRIKQLPPAEPVDYGYLADWFINSVGDEEPVWTEEHIDELMNDFYIIPKIEKGEEIG